MKRRLFASLLLIVGIACAPVAHASYSGLYVFGDSLSDTGNNAAVIGADPTQVITGNTYVPTNPYASGQYSNGNVWVHTFAAGLGLSAAPFVAGGGVFAFGGAQTSYDPPPFGFPPSLTTQMGMYLSLTGGLASSDALYVIAGGGNNARAALEAIGGGADVAATIGATAAQYAADIGAMVDSLQAAGAKDIVVWNTPNLGLAPAVTAGGAASSFLGMLVASSMNSALALELSDEAGVRLFDVFGLVSNIAQNPGLYGLSNVSDACGGIAGCDASKYLFWDGIHPTAAGHVILGNAMVAAIPEPETYAMLLAGLGLLGFALRRRAGKA